MLKMKSAAGPASYASASPPTMAFGEFEKVNTAIADITGAYKAVAVSISASTVTYRVYYYDYDAAADGVAIEVPDATDLSGETVTVIADGE